VKSRIHRGTKGAATSAKALGLAIVAWVIVASPRAMADGGIVRLSETQFGREVTVMTPPQLTAGTPIPFEVFVQRSDSDPITVNADVVLNFIPERVSVPERIPEFCGPNGNTTGISPQKAPAAFSVVALPSRATPLASYYAPVTFPAGGQWRLDVRVMDNDAKMVIRGQLTISEAIGGWKLVYPFIVCPLVAVALFLANQWLRMGEFALPRQALRTKPGIRRRRCSFVSNESKL
jgi:hypothetical protein